MGQSSCVLIVLGLWLVGCSRTDTAPPSWRGEGKGTLGLRLQPVAGITLSQVHYTVTQGTRLVGEGDLATPGSAASFSFGLSLPTGTGYALSLSGVALESPEVTCTGGFGPFNVTANANSDVSLVFSCADKRNGTIGTGLAIESDACPRLKIDSAVATPSVSAVGGTVSLLSSARDLDGRTVSYRWSSSSPAAVTFVSPTSRDTALLCNSVGDQLRLEVTANNGQCEKSLETLVSCINIDTCGNGVVDPGEDCDPDAGPCPADCTVVCGDGVSEAPVEECDPPKAGFCSATCHPTGSCGDGILQPAEQCDDGNTVGTDDCKNDCTPPDPDPVCGNTQLEAGELCDPPLSVENCGADCKAISKPECQTCAAINCEGAENCAGVPDSVQCNKTLDCVRDSGCADGGFALFCYCGAVSATECDTVGGARARARRKSKSAWAARIRSSSKATCST